MHHGEKGKTEWGEEGRGLGLWLLQACPGVSKDQRSTRTLCVKLDGHRLSF